MKLRIVALPTLLLMLALPGACQTTTHKATLTWSASTTTGATYTVLRGSVPGGTKTAIQSGVAVVTYVDANLPSGTQECYQVTVQAPGFLDSDPSNEICGTTGKDKAASVSGFAVVFQ